MTGVDTIEVLADEPALRERTRGWESRLDIFLVGDEVVLKYRARMLVLWSCEGNR